MSNQRCPKCGGYSYDSNDNCINCGYTIPTAKPPAWWGSKDFHGSGNKVINHIPKHEDTIREKVPIKDEHHINIVIELLLCPYCKEKSLYLNNNHMYECLNLRCNFNDRQTEREEKYKLADTSACSFCKGKTVIYMEYQDAYKCMNCENIFDNFFDDTVRYKYKDINSKTNNIFKRLFFHK